MVLKGVNWVHNDKIGWNGVERSGYTMMKWKESGVHNDKIRVKWSWKESMGYKMIKLGQMVLKGVNRVHNNKTGLNGLERSQLCTLMIKWSSWKESNRVHNDKIGCQMVLKGGNRVHNT